MIASRRPMVIENASFVLPKPDLSRLMPIVAGEMTDSRGRGKTENLAFLALGVQLGSIERSGKPDLPAAALAHIYALEFDTPTPDRQAVRCKLIAKVASSLGEPFASLLCDIKAFKFDPLSRRMYMAFAGLNKGTVTEADTALLREAFGITKLLDLAEAIVRAASRQAQASVSIPQTGIDHFAKSVIHVARRLETKPYSGRVAIAQVYDAAMEEGVSLGTLEEFKTKLAEAAREGLIDLERYDIAGPFDAMLKERSRLRLGRDERHFIVNQ